MENQEKEGGGYIEHLTWISKNYSQVALSQFEEKSFKDAVFCVMSESENVSYSDVSFCLQWVTPWTVAHQAPLSMGFSREEY